MLCHDQRLDRRIIAQTDSLIGMGHKVTLLALSFNCNREEKILNNGTQLVRIGLSSIIPENKCYCNYIHRQEKLNESLNKAACRIPSGLPMFKKIFDYKSRANWLFYRTRLLLSYRNLSLDDPLPFRHAFVSEGRNHSADLVQVHDLPTLEAGADLAGEWNVPLVYDSHELYPEQCSFSAVQQRICAMAESRLIKKASLIFTVNLSIAEEMARRYKIETPITLLNALDPPPAFDPEARYDLLRQKLKLSADRRILLFQGGYAPHRNLEAVIKAFSLLHSNNVDLVMLGFGDFGAKLKNSAQQLGLLGKRVHFLPAVPQEELLQHSASADIGIIPYPHVDLNSYYCTPNKLFEFIQARLPILANDSPELRRFVLDEGFGLTRPMKSPKQIASAIDEAFSNNHFAFWKQRLAERCGEFSWQVQSKIYIDAMQLFLNNENSQSAPWALKEHSRRSA
jgi:glycosyltransferase involved in cell wall biosynthesis